MSSITIQQIAGARYKTSAAADVLTKELMEHMGLSTKAAVARLALGRSLGMGPLSEELVDAKGLEIPAASLFRQDDLSFWIALILTHDLEYSAEPSKDLDSFRNLVRRHWHRGVHLLIQDWKDSGERFETFITNLVARRAELENDVWADESENSPTTANVEHEDLSEALSRALEEISVEAEVIGVVHGPRLSRYRVKLKDVGKLDKLRTSLDEVALLLNLQQNVPVLSAGDEAKVVSLDIARARSNWKTFGRAEFESAVRALPSDPNRLVVCPGTDTMGVAFSLDLTSAPHVLIGGATGQGKSVCMHSFILSLIMQNNKSNLLLALIDPKQVEFSAYERSPHLWRGKVAVGSGPAFETIDSLVKEMETRYTALKKAGVNNIVEGRRVGVKLPFVVVCIDELADLLIQNDSVETNLVRLAQMGRGAGIHLILATQRPDAKTITGLIRSNIPCRLALRVQRSSESKIILDDTGAENLLGAGDMLVKTGGDPGIRVHGYYLGLDDVKSIISAAR